jgi:hypothetical protein
MASIGGKMQIISMHTVFCQTLQNHQVQPQYLACEICGVSGVHLSTMIYPSLIHDNLVIMTQG